MIQELTSLYLSIVMYTMWNKYNILYSWNIKSEIAVMYYVYIRKL